MDNIADIINKQAEGIVKAMGMPEVKTTSLEEELSKTNKKKMFKTRVFVLLDDVSAEEYSAFINYLMSNKKTATVLREVENWTKDGELIRVVDYIEIEE